MSKSKIKNYIKNNTDRYFVSTQKIIEKFGDAKVVYIFFLRQNSIYAPYFVLSFLEEAKIALNLNFVLQECYQEGDIVPANSPIFFIEGSFRDLSVLETLILQKIGWPNIAAYNSYTMSKTLPNTSFISMGARHYATSDMANMIDYGVSVGSKKAKQEGAIGFLGSSTSEGAKFFGLKEGLGTMPHALIGYAKSTLAAAKMYHEVFPNQPLTVLVDYFGQEITDTLNLCNYFKELAEKGQLSVRIDTNRARYLEGLNEELSLKILKQYVKNFNITIFNQEEKENLIGTGVSGAAIFKMREELDNNNFPKVKIVASSGFDINKCLLMHKIKAPVDVIGTGSVIGSEIGNTYATADIISYNDVPLVKKGREHFIKAWEEFRKKI